MGAGRKKQTFVMQEKALPPWTSNGSVTSRNLGKSKLAGVIFGSKHNTMQECLSKQLFGLPTPHFSYVRNINPGLPLFLFNYSDRKLHGIFEATCNGTLNISPYAWTADGMDYTPFSAQVKFKTRMQCHPLLEDQFRPIIADNYYQAKLFWFELDQRQTNRLIALFSSSPIVGTVSSSESPRSLFEALQTVNLREDNNNSKAFSSNMNVACLDSKKKWSSLFQGSHTDVREDGEDCQKMTSELNLSNSNNSCYEWEEPFCAPHSSEEESEACEAFTNGSEIQSEIEEPALFTSSCYDVEVEGEEYKSAALQMNIPYSNIEDAAENMKGDALYESDEEKSWEGTPEEDIGSHLSSDCRLVAQLLAEVRELKLLHGKQVQKFNLMEQELAGSKNEIQSLRSRCEMIESGMNFKQSSMEGTELQSIKELPANLDESILIMGGFDGSSWLSTMNCYYPSRNSMESLPAMRFMRSLASTGKLNGEIYVLGGVNGSVWYDTVESYNVTNRQWFNRPSMNRKKGSLAGISLNNKIFAIGGGNGVECLSEVEMFDLDAGSWTLTSSMRQERFALAAGELNGILYAVGGFDGKNYLQSAEMFDPREKLWREIASMSTKRGCHCLAVLNEKLYAIGGYNGDDFIRTVEVFDPRRGVWTITEPMNETRGYSAAAVIGGDTIYVFGGMKNKKMELSETVECYKEDRSWELTNLTAFGKRCYFSAVVL
ncbi:ring canal kelch-like protein isoform X1 [Cucumis melo var. makuwa]|uniref:Ring canal kelch-like protein isoform X1 n=1 Tax=Cucumis melo var. makuwa TaxID=1194695 RepID=A0A5A7UGQ1_CUCMM|nr:ring canal kelch-like protein isoform X1 [Cucumis melo var. makuwa]